MKMAKAKYNSTEDVIKKLQETKGETKLKIYKNISNYFDNMNIRFDEDLYARNAQGISKISYGVLLLMSFLRTKPQFKNMNINLYDLYYAVIKNRGKREIVDDQYENDYINFNDIFPNHYIGRKNNNENLR